MTSNRWRIQLLGVLQISDGKESTSRFRTQMTGSILAYLAFHAGRPQPREVLANLFWPDVDSQQARRRLTIALSSLRAQIGRVNSKIEVFSSDKFTVALNPAIFETDVSAFQNALKRARHTTDLTKKQAFLQEAISYYTGDFLAGRYENWVIEEQDRLREQLEEAKRELALLDGRKPLPSQAENEKQPADVSLLPSQRRDVSMLPPTYTRFFGRNKELEQLVNDLSPQEERTLITLTGTGGIGKTRLAHEAGRLLQDKFPGRVWFVALADVCDGNRLLDAIRDALHLVKDPDTDTLDQCAVFLSSSPSLLILDNMEQLVNEGRAAVILQNLRDQVPSLLCLVTSRQILGIDGERMISVRPLTETEEGKETCITLFEDRARSVRSDFRVSEVNRSSVLQLCSVLDGIPLAIELAAARMGVLSVGQILSQMEARFTLLRSRRRDVPERHRSLWAAFDSSYQLLPANLQRFFACLSVFRGGWTLAAAQAICLDLDYANTDDPLEITLESMAELHESSLIFTDRDSDRYQMLETLREYAAEHLSKQERQVETSQRHSSYFAQLTSEAEPHLAVGMPAQQLWLDKLGYEHDNLRSAIGSNISGELALRTSTSLLRFWLTRGHINEGRDCLQKALDANSATRDIPDTELAAAQNALGVLAFAAGAINDARMHFDSARMHYEKLGNVENIARAQNNVGIVAVHTGDFLSARAAYAESLSLYRKLGETLRASMVQTNLAVVLLFLKDYAVAQEVLEECLPIQRAAGDDFTLWRTLQNVAEAALGLSDLVKAAKALHESFTIRQRLGDQSSLHDSLMTASMILGKCDKLAEACVVWAAAQTMRASTGTVTFPSNATEDQIWEVHIQDVLQEFVVDEMHQIGSQMNVEEAISYVIEHLAQIK